MGAKVTSDGKYLLITLYESTDPVNLLYWASLSDFDTNNGMNFLLFYFDLFNLSDFTLQVNKLITEFEAQYSYITNEGSLFYFLTNLDSPLYVSFL